jgi:hypothetical protein
MARWSVTVTIRAPQPRSKGHQDPDAVGFRVEALAVRRSGEFERAVEPAAAFADPASSPSSRSTHSR